MNWLSNSKVRLGLIVNGLYFLSLALPSATPSGVPNARGLNGRAAASARLRAAATAPDYPTLLAQAGPQKAATHYWKDSDQLDIYLSRELTLVRRRGHTLLLSPTFTARILNSQPPRSVLLYFTAFSHEQTYDRNSPFVIKADGTELWRYGWRAPGDETPSGMKALHSAALDGSGMVAETLGHEIPFDIFVWMVGAQRVTLQLGPDLVELTPEQRDALHDMIAVMREAYLPDEPAAGQVTPGAYLDPGHPRPTR